MEGLGVPSQGEHQRGGLFPTVLLQAYKKETSKRETKRKRRGGGGRRERERD